MTHRNGKKFGVLATVVAFGMLLTSCTSLSPGGRSLESVEAHVLDSDSAVTAVSASEDRSGLAKHLNLIVTLSTSAVSDGIMESTLTSVYDHAPDKYGVIVIYFEDAKFQTLDVSEAAASLNIEEASRPSGLSLRLTRKELAATVGK